MKYVKMWEYVEIFGNMWNVKLFRNVEMREYARISENVTISEMWKFANTWNMWNGDNICVFNSKPPTFNKYYHARDVIDVWKYINGGFQIFNKNHRDFTGNTQNDLYNFLILKRIINFQNLNLVLDFHTENL